MTVKGDVSAGHYHLKNRMTYIKHSLSGVKSKNQHQISGTSVTVSSQGLIKKTCIII
jgi:hypothetical protein